jgi:hypothetical protein
MLAANARARDPVGQSQEDGDGVEFVRYRSGELAVELEHLPGAFEWVDHQSGEHHSHFVQLVFE